MIENKLYLNGNYPSHAIFSETFILGESWLHDKRRSEYVGHVSKKKDSESWEVRQYSPYYDENNDIVIDSDYVVKELPTESEAIEYAREHFNIRKVIS